MWIGDREMRIDVMQELNLTVNQSCLDWGMLVSLKGGNFQGPPKQVRISGISILNVFPRVCLM